MSAHDVSTSANSVTAKIRNPLVEDLDRSKAPIGPNKHFKTVAKTVARQLRRQVILFQKNSIRKACRFAASELNVPWSEIYELEEIVSVWLMKRYDPTYFMRPVARTRAQRLQEEENLLETYCAIAKTKRNPTIKLVKLVLAKDLNERPSSTKLSRIIRGNANTKKFKAALDQLDDPMAKLIVRGVREILPDGNMCVVRKKELRDASIFGASDTDKNIEQIRTSPYGLGISNAICAGEYVAFSRRSISDADLLRKLTAAVKLKHVRGFPNLRDLYASRTLNERLVMAIERIFQRNESLHDLEMLAEMCAESLDSTKLKGTIRRAHSLEDRNKYLRATQKNTTDPAHRAGLRRMNYLLQNLPGCGLSCVNTIKKVFEKTQDEHHRTNGIFDRVQIEKMLKFCEVIDYFSE